MSKGIIKVDFKLGIWVKEALEEARLIAKRLGVTVECELNGVRFLINEDSCIDSKIEFYRDYGSDTKQKTKKVDYSKFYILRTPERYNGADGVFEVLWIDIFMPFDVLCGLDSVPRDNMDYTKHKKTHWWVRPQIKRDFCNTHDISMFMELPLSKEFNTLDEAIEYCFEWREEWLKRELSLV